MTNQEIQSIIKIGDICITSKDGVYRKFVGYDKCEWQNVVMNNRYDSCSTCKGRMIFEDIHLKARTVRCHSHTGKCGNKTDVEINHQILPEELFEL